MTCVNLGIRLAATNRVLFTTEESRADDGRDKIAKDVGERSGIQVIHYACLTELVPELLDMADEKKIAFNPTYELFFLKSEDQRQLIVVMDEEQATLSQAQ